MAGRGKIADRWVLFMIVFAVAWCAPAQDRVELQLLPASPWDSNRTHQVAWGTRDGVRYELQASGDLTNWTAVTGWPRLAFGEADAYAFDAAGPDRVRLFRVAEHDEQAPTVTGRVPGDGAFAVPRFSSISFSLSDVSGVDPASLALTVGDRGTFTVASPETTFTNGVFIFDPGGDTALGPYGADVLVSLAAADVNGRAATNHWSFDLETEPEVTTNLFVFGSPQARRSGQRIGAIPTRILSDRAAGGPIRMAAGTNPWELFAVVTNGLVVSYTGNQAPPFNPGAYVANLTPATTDEIFYRQITGTYDDPDRKRLVLFTRDAALTELVEEGTFTLSDDAMVFEVSTNGALVRAVLPARSVSGDFSLSLPVFAYSLDGRRLSPAGSGLTITAEEVGIQLSPRIESSLDIQAGKVRRFSAVVHGGVQNTLVYSLHAQAGASYSGTIYDLPFHKQPRKPIPFSIGPVPGWIEVGLDFQIDADVDAEADAEARFGFRQQINIGCGARYENGRVEWVREFRPDPAQTVPFSPSVGGVLSGGLTLRPTVYVTVDSLAGIDTGPALRAGMRTEWENTQLAGYLEGLAAWEMEALPRRRRSGHRPPSRRPDRRSRRIGHFQLLRLGLPPRLLPVVPQQHPAAWPDGPDAHSFARHLPPCR